MLVGVSRTSRQPTCVYLAHRGIKAANVPLVLLDLPQLAILEQLKRPLIVGLTINPEQHLPYPSQPPTGCSAWRGTRRSLRWPLRRSRPCACEELRLCAPAVRAARLGRKST
ncbi:MAG: kinase/pyrophosphorylase [Geminicoccaceae bacterium]